MRNMSDARQGSNVRDYWSHMNEFRHSMCHCVKSWCVSPEQNPQKQCYRDMIRGSFCKDDPLTQSVIALRSQNGQIAVTNHKVAVADPRVVGLIFQRWEQPEGHRRIGSFVVLVLGFVKSYLDVGLTLTHMNWLRRL
ncbi:hypothetical protein PV10_00202 [Exophiala mesophila]|uniref:Uncharacterized protein n=1 Tax=Exophiala mesophila TaxID=212818 RepID=A0A0D1X3C3_EXOME|nr:uncharacterized protein PV10_00202 [Exophiala mesophila]KIV96320.1 hypothetical protein PV10_00202 [Exophiala mesophila]